ncbi:MAG: hypothetical protein KJO69_03125 [Gammaproteobacteria bacterium]|nr:hypothetical protein [Gammaproteobacteria bacterium]NNJ72772.1 hypothetical protein [Enterobacterales bacterium]
MNARINTIVIKHCCISVALLSLVACQSPEESTMPETDMAKETQETSKMMTATVKYIAIEGGFYGLETADGQQFLPRNLDKNYQTDGTVIRFKVQPVEGVMTTQQWGTLVRLSDVELVKKAVDESEL